MIRAPVSVVLGALLYAVACTNDYGSLDFSGGLDDDLGSAGTRTGGTGGSRGGAGAAPGGTGTGAVGGVGAGGSTGARGGSGGDLPDASTGGTGGPDAGGAGGQGGLGGTGAGGKLDASVDAAPDVATTDSGTDPIDATPDAPLWDGAAVADCASIYGSSTDYVFCSASVTSCTFAVTTSGSNCDSVCSNAGMSCLDANDNGTDPCVPTNTADDCQTARTTTICVCAR